MKCLPIILALYVSAGIDVGHAQRKDDPFMSVRIRMVERQIETRGVKDKRVLEAMRTVPRHRFIPGVLESQAYNDSPLSIGEGQTISQPYVVAFMTEALDLDPGDRVLEIGTGSGYQAAVLAELVADVYTVEIIPRLGERAERILGELGYDNVHVHIGDGYEGWSEHAPYDAVIVTCAPEAIPAMLIEQLAEGGRMIIPVGGRYSVQNLVRGVKRNDRLDAREVLPVRFVPMVRGHER